LRLFLYARALKAPRVGGRLSLTQRMRKKWEVISNDLNNAEALFHNPARLEPVAVVGITHSVIIFRHLIAFAELDAHN